MRTVEWVGEHRGAAWETSGSLRLHAGRQSGGSAFGQLRCAEYEVAWQLVARSGWVLRSLDVRLIGSTGGRRVNRTLLLEHSDQGWRSTAWSADQAQIAAPGLAMIGDPGLYQDIVLDACPLTHVVPLRRLGLAGPGRDANRPGRRALAGLPALRVLLPSLAVVATRQRYHWVADDDRAVRLRHAFAAEDPTELTVDAQGVPLRFGGLSRHSDTALVA